MRKMHICTYYHYYMRAVSVYILTSDTGTGTGEVAKINA